MPQNMFKADLLKELRKPYRVFAHVTNAWVAKDGVKKASTFVLYKGAAIKTIQAAEDDAIFWVLIKKEIYVRHPHDSLMIVGHT